MRTIMASVIFTVFMGTAASYAKKRPVDSKVARAHELVIADYIKAVDEKYHQHADTLFIGRHADFPNITLPEVIAGTHIKLVAADDFRKIQSEPDNVYLNIMSWFSAGDAEFVVVTFRNGGHPQHMYKLNLEFDKKTGGFRARDQRFESPETSSRK